VEALERATLDDDNRVWINFEGELHGLLQYIYICLIL
jgi:hypothetical protein